MVTREMTLSYAEACARVMEVAGGLIERGVRPGDRVAVVADNAVENVIAWLAINAAMAIDVPISVEARGASLEYALRDTAPRAVVCSAAQLTRVLPAVDALEGVLFIAVIGERPAESASTQLIEFDSPATHRIAAAKRFAGDDRDSHVYVRNDRSSQGRHAPPWLLPVVRREHRTADAAETYGPHLLRATALAH